MKNQNPFPNLPPEIAEALRQGYQQALETLCETMKNPDRERDEVRERLRDLTTRGRCLEEHIPTLMRLERITRETGGTGYMEVERTIFKELEGIDHPDLPSFLLEAFQYRRRYDNYAGKRRARALELTVMISIRTETAEAIDALIEMLSTPRDEVRDEALKLLYHTYQWEEYPIPPALVEHIHKMAAEDTSEDVLATAHAILEVLGEITYNEHGEPQRKM